MARARLLSKAISTSRKFAALAAASPEHGEFHQLVYCLLIPHSDDFGRMSGDAWTVKVTILPASVRPDSHFERALTELEHVGLIRRSPDNKTLQINQFEDHQSGLHKRTRSRFPPVPELPGTSGKLAGIPSELKGTEQKGIEEDQDQDRRAARGPALAKTAKRSLRVLQAVIADLIRRDRKWLDAPEGDLAEEAKTAAAKMGIIYDGRTIGAAMRAARGQFNPNHRRHP